MASKNYDRRPRPSSLPHLADCPRFVSSPDGRVDKSLAEAADEGTIIHEQMENLAQHPEETWDDVISKMDAEPAHVDLIRACAEQVRDLFQLGLPVYSIKTPGVKSEDGEHYLLSDVPTPDKCVCAEVSVDPTVCQPGTADLLMVCGTRAVVVDFKTVRVIRTHSQQLMAYVIGVFRALPQVEFVEVRIVTPRLGEVHDHVTYSRKNDLANIEREIQELVDAAGDPFTPGSPGEACAMCSGNGRCPWQMASLRDIPLPVAALIQPNAWSALMVAETPDLRGERRMLKKWLDAWSDAVAEDDKLWATQNPDTMMPGFTKTVAAGRASLDKDRLREANTALMGRFGLRADDLLGYCVPDKSRLGEYVAIMTGSSQKEAEIEISKALSEYTVRGGDIISFRAVKKKTGPAAIE